MDEKKASAGTVGAAAAPERPQGTWSESALRVLRERYLLRDAGGAVAETPDELCWRVARAVSAAEAQWSGTTGVAPEQVAEQFYQVMVERKFLPNSPTLMNAGKGNNLQLSACYVVPVEDSLQGIFDAVKHAALIHQSGGGTGFSFSRLRPEGSMVASTHGVASGPVSFMKIFDGATEAVKQGGCVVPETRVSTSRGMVQIGTLGPTGAEPKSWHALRDTLVVATDEGGRRAEEFYFNGRSPVRRVRTTHGYHFTGTPQHRVRVIDQDGQYVWRHLSELQVGDWVVLQKNTCPKDTGYHFPPSDRTPHFNATPITIPERPTPELGEFIGYLIGDGCINYYNPGHGTGRLILTVADTEPEVAEHLLRTAEQVFGVVPLPRKKPNDASTNYFFNSTELVTWLRHTGVTKESTLDARVPEIAFQAGAEFARGFIRGLFTADGTVSKDGYPQLYSISRELVDELQQLLLALGIPSTVSVSHHREHALGKNPVYRLRPITREGLREFAARIGFISAAKNARLEVGLEKAWEFNDVIPNQQPAIAAIYDGPGRGSGPGRSSRGADRELYRDVQHYLPGVAASRNLTRSRLVALAEKHEEVRSSPLAAFLTNSQFYDRVTVIEEDEAVTVDLSVEENHTYIANGFVSHNTRRGANMGILRVDHPDILKFIDCKRDGSVTNFNISVAITDEFMRALDADDEYDLVDPHTKQVARRLRARDVMDRIVSAAWATGDPGLVFIDRANRSSANPTPDIELLEATNPCFTGDTLVWTAQGPQRFDTLAQTGAPVDVLTQTAAGEIVLRTMRAPRRTRSDVPVWRVTLRAADGSIGGFTATPDHEIFLRGGGSKPVESLRPGDRLASAYAASAEVMRALGGATLAAKENAQEQEAVYNHEVVSVEPAGRADVYCGTVDETHRFFVVTEDGGSILAANCGEQWLGPYDACNLGSINLGLFIKDGAIDWDELERVTRLTTRFLDDVIDINPFPLPEVHEKVHANRRIGLGVMGWAELLFELGLRYDSAEAVALGERVMLRIRDWSSDESVRMAEERGAFSNWERSIYKRERPRRNATCTTVAPTGSISILADCSSGIEPIFALAFQHRVKQPDGSYRVLDFVNPFFQRALEASDIEDKQGVLDYAKTHGALHGHPAAEHPALRPYVTAHEIAPDWHIRMQAAFQKGVDNSISKTINVPNSATLDDVRDAYRLAWDLGCLGITIFRDGSKSEQVLNVGVKEQQGKRSEQSEQSEQKGAPLAGQSSAQQPPDPAETAAEQSPAVSQPAATPASTPAPAAARHGIYQNGVKMRPEVVSGYTRRVRAPEGNVNVTLNSDEDGLLEVFVNIGKAGSDVAALAEALGRLISLHLRLDSPISQNERAREVARQLGAIGGSTSIGFGPNRVRSLPDAVARALEAHLNGSAAAVAPAPASDITDEPQAAEASGHAPASGSAPTNGSAGGGGQPNGHGPNPGTLALYTVTGNLCPQCGNNTLYMEEGCKKCVSCGHSEC